MSTVTDIILTAQCGSDADLSPIEAAFGHEQKFVQVDEHAGGGKAMQADVWLASINHADHAAILRGLASVDWAGSRESVTMMMNFEHGESFEPVVVGGQLTTRGLQLLAGVETDPSQWWNCKWYAR